ncbi:hypothetical protein [Chryseobacterium bernardetii]|uniref:hypothetical protein n=1 Tax=Chryseobacterium bernardetii TaxID=1241978 RepID=UPI0013DDCC43|nr:hypothetical protein [Chryseobacterium bernardetii]
MKKVLTQKKLSRENLKKFKEQDKWYAVLYPVQILQHALFGKNCQQNAQIYLTVYNQHH